MKGSSFLNEPGNDLDGVVRSPRVLGILGWFILSAEVMEYRGKGSTECWEATSYEKRGSCLPLKFQIDYWYLVYQSLNKRGFLLSSLLKALTPILSFHNFPFSLNSMYTFINGLFSQVWRQNVEGCFHK